MARNIVLFIGDGMGQGPITAASYYSYGKPDWLTFERFPVRGRMSVLDAYGDVPESASSGTAMATCHKVERGVVSMAIPGDGRELTTVLELLQASGKWAGLVTSSLMTDASPASFGAHETSRDHHAAIAGDYLYQTRPRLLLGGGGPGFGPAEARAAGYTVVEDRQSMLELDPAGVDRLAGAFGSGLLPFRDETHASTPTLPEMTRSAIRFLERSEDGFFLLVEEERIDSYAHANDTARTVQAVLELVAAVRVARDWARDANDSLIIVTADHDTGGLEVVAGKGAGKLPEVRWSSQQHTCEPVPVFATGPDSEWIGATLDNTDLAGIMAPPIVTDDCG